MVKTMVMATTTCRCSSTRLCGRWRRRPWSQCQRQAAARARAGGEEEGEGGAVVAVGWGVESLLQQQQHQQCRHRHHPPHRHHHPRRCLVARVQVPLRGSKPCDSQQDQGGAVGVVEEGEEEEGEGEVAACRLLLIHANVRATTTTVITTMMKTMTMTTTMTMMRSHRRCNRWLSSTSPVPLSVNVLRRPQLQSPRPLMRRSDLPQNTSRI